MKSYNKNMENALKSKRNKDWKERKPKLTLVNSCEEEMLEREMVLWPKTLKKVWRWSLGGEKAFEWSENPRKLNGRWACKRESVDWEGSSPRSLGFQSFASEEERNEINDLIYLVKWVPPYTWLEITLVGPEWKRRRRQSYLPKFLISKKWIFDKFRNFGDLGTDLVWKDCFALFLEKRDFWVSIEIRQNMKVSLKF